MSPFCNSFLRLRYIEFSIWCCCSGRNKCNAVSVVFRKPTIAIRALRDAIRPAVVLIGSGAFRQRELCDSASNGDPANPVSIEFRKPEVTVRPGDDAWKSIPKLIAVGGKRELCDHATSSDT